MWWESDKKNTYSESNFVQWSLAMKKTIETGPKAMRAQLLRAKTFTQSH